MFKSYSQNSTIAGLLDIQYRSWSRATSKMFDGGKRFVAGKYRRIESLIASRKYVFVEGLIVDMISGGIGFRNHTVPSQHENTVNWSEDILWIAPDISCQRLNLTYEFILPGVRDLSLVADESFTSIDLETERKLFADVSIQQPNVAQRAEDSVWLHNKILKENPDLLKWIITPPAADLLSQDMRNSQSAVRKLLTPTGVKASDLQPSKFLGLPTYTFDDGGDLVKGDWNTLDYYGLAGRLNDSGGWIEYEDRRLLVVGNVTKYEVDIAKLNDVANLCSGRVNEHSRRNDFNVECGYFLTPPRRIDGGSPQEEDSGSKWGASLHLCASAIKASVKTIRFAASTDRSFSDSISLDAIADKTYEGGAELPTWALEDWHFRNKSGARNVPLWGVVDKSHLGAQGFNFTQAESFYLPGVRPQLRTSATGKIRTLEVLDSLAGAFAPFGTLSALFSIAMTGYGNKYAMKYDGSDSLSLMNTWNELSGHPRGSEDILKLVWTDIMASLTVGANSRPVPAGPGQQPPTGEVTQMRRTITYDLRFAAAAILLLVLYLATAAAALTVCVSYAPLLWQLKHLLNDTAVGRSAAPAAFEDARGHARASTALWLRAVGHMRLRLGQEYLPLAPPEEDAAADDDPSIQQKGGRPSPAVSATETSSDTTLLDTDTASVSTLTDDEARLIQAAITASPEPPHAHSPRASGADLRPPPRQTSRQRAPWGGTSRSVSPLDRAPSAGGGRLARSDSWRAGDEDAWSAEGEAGGEGGRGSRGRGREKVSPVVSVRRL